MAFAISGVIFVGTFCSVGISHSSKIPRPFWRYRPFLYSPTKVYLLLVLVSIRGVIGVAYVRRKDEELAVHSTSLLGLV
jgi:hypothetical protein